MAQPVRVKLTAGTAGPGGLSLLSDRRWGWGQEEERSELCGEVEAAGFPGDSFWAMMDDSSECRADRPTELKRHGFLSGGV